MIRPHGKLLLLLAVTVLFLPAPLVAAGPQRGQVKEIDDTRIVVSGQEGKNVSFQILSQTQFVREIRVSQGAFGIGDRLLIMGYRAGQSPRTVIILAEEDGSAPLPGQGEQGDGHGPTFARVTATVPLTITLASGDSASLILSEETRILKQVPVSRSEIQSGTEVLVIAPPRSSGTKGRAAFTVIVPPEPEMGKVVFADNPGFSSGQRLERRESARRYADSPFGFLMAPPQPGYLLDLDVNWFVTGIHLAPWEDIETSPGQYDFSRTDKIFSYLSENGLNTVVELRAINPLYGTQSGKRGPLGAAYPERYMRQWAAFVTAFVERYDGDHINDAPGHPVVRTYQLSHEILMPGHFTGKGFWRENPDKYADYFKTTYDAVKRACSDCSLYLIGGFYEDFLSKGEKDLKGASVAEDGFFINLLEVFARRGLRFEPLGFDYHYWSAWNFVPQSGPDSYLLHQEIIDRIARLARSHGYQDDQVSIISTESGVNGLLETEADQAVYIVKSYASAIAAGQDHLFWTSLVEYGQEAGLYLHMGLVNNPRHQGYSHNKLGYYTYKLMVDKLKETDWSRVRFVRNGEGNVFVVEFPGRDGRPPVYVAWWDAFNEPGRKKKEVQLQLGLDTATITSAVPEGGSGREITAAATFRTETRRAVGKTLSLELGHEPVFIEPGVAGTPTYPVRQVSPAWIDSYIE